MFLLVPPHRVSRSVTPGPVSMMQLQEEQKDRGVSGGGTWRRAVLLESGWRVSLC